MCCTLECMARSTLRDFCANKSLLPEGFMLFITGLIKLWTQGVDRLVKLKIPLTQLDCNLAGFCWLFKLRFRSPVLQPVPW